jgi:hypothetical protein
MILGGDVISKAYNFEYGQAWPKSEKNRKSDIKKPA